MKKFNGTKGEWKIRGESSSLIDIGTEKNGVSYVYKTKNNEGENNAKLIVKAPDLLRILMDCRTHFEAIENLGLQNNAPDWLIQQVNKVLEETLT